MAPRRVPSPLRALVRRTLAAALAFLNAHPSLRAVVRAVLRRIPFVHGHLRAFALAREGRPLARRATAADADAARRSAQTRAAYARLAAAIERERPPGGEAPSR